MRRRAGTQKRIYMNEGVRLIGVTASNLAPPLETVDLFRL